MAKGKGGGGRVSGDRTTSIAAKVLQTGKATPSQAKSLAGSVMAQNPDKGPNKKR